MSYGLELTDEATDQIAKYVRERFPGSVAQQWAVDEIESHLERLADNPVVLGKSTPDPFTFPTFTFKAEILGMERLYKVVFCYDVNERSIWILGFKPLLMF